jgi:hypothetical protein
MRRIATAMTIAAGLAVMAAPAVAQVGTDARERPAFQGRGMMAGPGIRAQNPGALLLERRAELGLTADQVRQIEAIQARVQQQNAARIEQLRAAHADRPERNFRDMSAEERQQLRAQMRERMEELQPLRQALRETNRAAGQELHALLTDAQREQLRTLRREQMREFRGQRGERGAGEWQGRRGERRGDGEGRRPHRGPRGGGF